MSTASDRISCISHKQNTYFFVMYEDFLEVASVSEHQYKLAAFWRILETKTSDRMNANETARREGRPPRDLWIEITYGECAERSLGLYKESSFQVAAAESERLGFSKSRVRQRPRDPLDPNSKKVDYKEYLLLTDILQHAIHTGELPPPIEINSPLLKSIATRKEAKKEAKKRKEAIDFNTPPIEINTPPIEINSKKNLNSIDNIPLLPPPGAQEDPHPQKEDEEEDFSHQASPVGKQEPPRKEPVPSKQEAPKQEWGTPEAVVALVSKFQHMTYSPDQVAKELPQARKLLRQVHEDEHGQDVHFSKKDLLLVLEDCLGKECSGGWYKSGILTVEKLAGGIAVTTYAKLANRKRSANKELALTGPPRGREPKHGEDPWARL